LLNGSGDIYYKLTKPKKEETNDNKLFKFFGLDGLLIKVM